jgi:hypothetical protein
MNDGFERRLGDAFGREPLPAAPETLVEALERVPDAPVVARHRPRGRSHWGALGLAAVLAIGGAVALSVGQRGTGPVPPDRSSASPTAPTDSAPVLGVVLDVVPVDGRQPTADELATIVEIVSHRMDLAGFGDVVVTPVGQTGIVVEIPSGASADAVRRLVGQTGRVDFVPLGDQPAEEGDTIDLELNPPLFGGDAIESAAAGEDLGGGRTLDLTLKPDAAKLFADYTAANVGMYVAIVIDGRVLSAPMIQAAIPGGRVQIMSGDIGGFKADELRGLVAILSSGPLPFPLQETGSGAAGAPTPAP